MPHGLTSLNQGLHFAITKVCPSVVFSPDPLNPIKYCIHLVSLCLAV